MLLTTLVTGPRAVDRERAIAMAIEPGLPTAIILEGIASGSSHLDALAENPQIQLVRIAPGCMCCTGNLTLRVTLNRILRHPPHRLLIGLATDTHIAQIRKFLTDPPYDVLLTISDTLIAAPAKD
jgi:G3E family GTPase